MIHAESACMIPIFIIIAWCLLIDLSYVICPEVYNYSERIIASYKAVLIIISTGFKQALVFTARSLHFD